MKSKAEKNKPMKYSILYRFTFYAHVVYKRSFYVPEIQTKRFSYFFFGICGFDIDGTIMGDKFIGER